MMVTLLLTLCGSLAPVGNHVEKAATEAPIQTDDREAAAARGGGRERLRGATAGRRGCPVRTGVEKVRRLVYPDNHLH